VVIFTVSLLGATVDNSGKVRDAMVYFFLRVKYNYFILNIRIYFTLQDRAKGRLLLPLPHPCPGGMPCPLWALCNNITLKIRGHIIYNCLLYGKL